MKKVLLCFLLVTSFVCERIRFGIADWILRCENDEIICYNYNSRQGTSLSCKWKEEECKSQH
jgi:hypothetical protein